MSDQVELAKINADVLPTVRLRELARFLNVPGNRELDREELLILVARRQREILRTFK